MRWKNVSREGRNVRQRNESERDTDKYEEKGKEMRRGSGRSKKRDGKRE